LIRGETALRSIGGRIELIVIIAMSVVVVLSLLLILLIVVLCLVLDIPRLLGL
jgi:hypothetical protein